MMIQIADNVWISDDDVVFKASRSSGPGGQNVNKLNTRVTLLFDVPKCRTLSEEQKQRVLVCLSTRADKAGVIRVVSQRFRSQKGNRDAALIRLQQLLQDALTELPVRKRTKAPASAHQRRLDAKKHRGILKRERTVRILDRGEDQ
jgi:ribosome-associated protein